MIKDYFLFALSSFSHRKTRSYLTMIGIFIGIAAVVALISVGFGLQEAINKQFEQLGTNIVTVQAGAVQMGPPGSSVTAAKLTEHDIDAIKKVKGVDVATGMLFKIDKIEFADEVKYEFVSGLHPDETMEMIGDAQGYKIVEGRNIRAGDKYKAVVGYSLAQGDVFKKEVKLRDKILIADQEFAVMGILGKIGNPYDDASVIIPFESAKEIFNNTDEISFIMVRTKEGYDTSRVAEDIKKAMRKDRNVEEGEEDFRVETAEQLMETFTQVFGIVQAVLIGIAAISLLVGGIGIMNTMYTAVLERTKEIGIMKAIGARNADVMFIFLIESGLLGLSGGAIGVLLGLGLGKAVEIMASYGGFGMLKASFSPFLILGALLFSSLIGSISGLLPAKKAASLKPVDALRYE